MTIESVYVEIADLTFSHCKRTCRNLGSCCSVEYCEFSIDYAKSHFNVDLVPTGNLLPLMGTDGKCTAPPHLRPMCARHSCQISSLGIFKDEPSLTDKYFELTDLASELEANLFL